MSAFGGKADTAFRSANVGIITTLPMKAAFESRQLFLFGEFAENKFFDDGQWGPHSCKSASTD
jgi:hypothetical protein